MLVLAQSTRCPDSRIIFWSGPLVSLIWQIHYSVYCILVFFLIWFVVSAYKRRIRWLWAMGGFVAGFILFFPHLYFLIHSNFQSIRQAFAGGVGDPIPFFPNIINLLKIFGETSFAGGFGFFFQGSQFNTISLAETPVGTTHSWLSPPRRRLRIFRALCRTTPARPIKDLHFLAPVIARLCSRGR